MSDATVLCMRCGFANGRGDQFCGSCGAFMEWEGQPDGAVAAAGTVAPGVPVDDTGLAGLVRQATTPAATTPPSPMTAPPAWTAPAAPPSPGTVAAPIPTPPDAGLLRCPACGIANAASRTFCQSCGATLAGTARVAGRSAEEIAAAVNAAPVARPVPTSIPTAAAGRSQPAEKRGGIAGWVVAVALIGIIAGVGFVAASTLLKGSGPASVASAAPSVPLASAAGPSASSPAASGPAAAASPTAAAPGKPLKMIGAAASSVLGDQAQYQAQMVIDGSTSTSWQEGSATEKGQWIEVSFGPARVDAVVINNGFDKSTALFKGNLRLKDVLISVNGGAPVAVRLKDTSNAQTIALTPVSGATSLRITIQTTYPSVKTSVAGTPFQDAAVSEISVVGAAGG